MNKQTREYVDGIVGWLQEMYKGEINPDVKREIIDAIEAIVVSITIEGFNDETK